MLDADREQFFSSALLAVLFGLSFLGFLLVQSGTFSSCVPRTITDEQHKVIASLDSIVDLGLKLSTTLVGFGAAVLIGIKSEVKISRRMRVVIVGATLLFVQSALYAVWWRFGLAEVQFNSCFGLIATPYVHWRFQAHIYTFMLGLGAIAVLVIGMINKKPEPEYDT